MSTDQEQAPRLLYVGSGPPWSGGEASVLADVAGEPAELTVSTAEAALELVERQPVSAVVAQYDLPDSDGISLLARCLDAQPGLVAILCSERSSPSLVDRAFEAGVDEFVHDTGPETQRLLANHLQRYLDGGETASDPVSSGGLLESVAATSPVGIVVIDEDDTFRFINDTAAELLGIDGYDGPLRETALDVDLLSFDGEAEGDDRRPHRRVLEDGETVRGEARLAVGSETRTVSVTGTPLYDTDGAVTSSVFSLEEITDRKERERRLQQQNAVVQTVRDGLYAVDDEDRFVVVNDAYTDLSGYDREELLGNPASAFFETRLIEEADDLVAEIEDNGEQSATLEATLTTASSEQIPIEAHISVFELDDDRYGRAGVVRDISERKRREERLASLNEVGQALTTAETAGEVADSEGRVLNDLAEETTFETGETPFESAILLPIGRHGVFVAGATDTHAFTDTDVMVAEILVANAVAALDRVDRERELREKTTQLAEHNESLQRINRLNDIIRNLTQDLTQAATRADIEAAVCERLVDADPYVFAWIGEQRASGGEVVPRASAGDGDGYLEWLTDSDRTTSGETPTERAIRTREPVVENSLHADPPLAPWQTQALRVAIAPASRSR